MNQNDADRMSLLEKAAHRLSHSALAKAGAPGAPVASSFTAYPEGSAPRAPAGSVSRGTRGTQDAGGWDPRVHGSGDPEPWDSGHHGEEVAIDLAGLKAAGRPRGRPFAFDQGVTDTA